MGLESVHVYGAVFIAYMVIKEVFVLVKGETKEILKKVNSMSERLDEMKVVSSGMAEMQAWHKERESLYIRMDEALNQVDDLWDWHNKEDGDGVRIWYVRSSLQKTLDNLGDILQKEHELASKIIDKMTILETDVDNIKEELNKRK